MKLVILSVLLIALLLVVPVLAVDSPETGSATDAANKYVTIGGAYNSVNDAPRLLNNIYIFSQDFYTANTLVAMYGTFIVGSTGVQLPAVNSSSRNVYIMNLTGTVIGSGTFGYSIDMHNHCNVFLQLSNWNKAVLATMPALPLNAYYFDDDGLGASPVWSDPLTFFLNYNYYVTPPISDYGATFSYFYFYPTISSGTTIVYQNFMDVDYSIVRAFPFDTYTINRNSGGSQISLGFYQPDCSVTGLLSSNEYSPTLDAVSVPNGTGSIMIVINPVTKNEFDFNWGPIPSCVNQKVLVYTYDGSTGNLLGSTTISALNTTTLTDNWVSLLATGSASKNFPVNGYTWDFGATRGLTYLPGVNNGGTVNQSVTINTLDIANPPRVILNLYPNYTHGTVQLVARTQIDGVYYFVDGAAVTVQNTTTSLGTKITNVKGWTSFPVVSSADYTYSAVKSGLAGGTGSFNLNGATTQIVYIDMLGGTIGEPTTVVPTGTPTLATKDTATKDVSDTFYNAAGIIAMLVVLAIIMGLVDMISGGAISGRRQG